MEVVTIKVDLYKYNLFLWCGVLLTYIIDFCTTLYLASLLKCSLVCKYAKLSLVCVQYAKCSLVDLQYAKLLIYSSV